MTHHGLRRGHSDRTGGLLYALGHIGQRQLRLHLWKLLPCYSASHNPMRQISLPSITELERRQQEQRLVWTAQRVAVVPGFFAPGELSPKNQEKTREDLCLDAESCEPDQVLDDQALYIDTNSGVMAILGSAHVGVVNSLDYIRQITHRPIDAVLGGAHLANSSAQRRMQTTTTLRAMNLPAIASAHCSGPPAMTALWPVFPDPIADGSVGTQWTFTQHAPRTL